MQTIKKRIGFATINTEFFNITVLTCLLLKEKAGTLEI